MASQASIVACGTRLALLAMFLKFIVGPAIMAAPSIAIGLKGVPFKIAVIQVINCYRVIPCFCFRYYIYNIIKFRIRIN